MGDETARKRDALRLSAGHLAGTMTFQAVELKPFEPGPRAAQGFLAAGPAEKEWQRDVLLRGQLWDELAKLEDEAEAITSQPGALLFAHRVEALAIEEDLTGVRDEDARQAVEQGRLARTARPHHGEDLAALHREAGTTKRWRLSEGKHEIARFENRAVRSGLQARPFTGFTTPPPRRAPRAEPR